MEHEAPIVFDTETENEASQEVKPAGICKVKVFDRKTGGEFKAIELSYSNGDCVYLPYYVNEGNYVITQAD